MHPDPLPRLNDPAWVAWNTVARFDDYASAQRAVDQLSDDGFPVGTLDIVGSTPGNGSPGGCPGAGGRHGVQLGCRTRSSAWGVWRGGLAPGGALGFAPTRRPWPARFSSATAAGRYDLIAREGAADRARTMLGQVGLLPAGRG